MKQNRKEPRLMDLQWVRRALLLFLGDVVIIIMASVGALIARFDFSYSSIDAVYLDSNVIAAAAFAVWYLGWSPIYILIAAAAIGISWTLLITKKAKK